MTECFWGGWTSPFSTGAFWEPKKKSHNIEQINGKKKDTITGVHNLSEKITYQTKRLKDLHISIVFKAFLVYELEIIPK